MLVLGLALAAVIGLTLGLVGGGGSILTVPVLVYVLGYAGYLGTVDLDWSFLAGFTAAAVAGALAGTALIAVVPQAALKRAFAVFLLIAGGFVLYENRDAFRFRTHNFQRDSTCSSSASTTPSSRRRATSSAVSAPASRWSSIRTVTSSSTSMPPRRKGSALRT